MKVMRYNLKSETSPRVRLGVLVNGDTVADLQAGFAYFLRETHSSGQADEMTASAIPANLVALLANGPAGLKTAIELVPYLEDLSDREAISSSGDRIFAPLSDCRLHAAIRPNKMIAVSHNYSDVSAREKVKLPLAAPSAWIKATSAVTGPARDIIRPACVKELDYETELAVIIGQKAKNVSEENAYSVIAGYAIANDISARDVIHVEREGGNQLLGKMFDSFAPLGPWLVTKDEVKDPMNLRVVTRVNGEIRQDGNTRDMIWSIPRLVAYLSQMTLEAGDVILTGTPAGVAMGRGTGEPSWFLQPGDILESEIEGLGTMRNKVVDAPSGEAKWKW